MIECSGPKVSDPHKNLEIRERQAVGGEVSASTCIEPLLQPGEIKWDRAVDERLALHFLLLIRNEKGRPDLVGDVLHGLHGLLA